MCMHVYIYIKNRRGSVGFAMFFFQNIYVSFHLENLLQSAPVGIPPKNSQ